MFDTCSLASNIKNYTVQSIHEMKVTLKFQHLGNSDDLSLVVFNDASLGSLQDGGTQGGVLIGLMEKQ